MLAWSCAVLFSDNAADFAALKQLTEQRNALAARRDEMEASFTANARACQVCQCLRPTPFLDCCKPACMMHPTKRSSYEAPLSSYEAPLKTELGHLSVIMRENTERSALQEAGRELKDARALVGARRRAFPRHAPSSHAAALEALERMRQDQAVSGPSLPQVSPCFIVHMHCILSCLVSSALLLEAQALVGWHHAAVLLQALEQKRTTLSLAAGLTDRGALWGVQERDGGGAAQVHGDGGR